MAENEDYLSILDEDPSLQELFGEFVLLLINPCPELPIEPDYDFNRAAELVRYFRDHRGEEPERLVLFEALMPESKRSAETHFTVITNHLPACIKAAVQKLAIDEHAQKLRKEPRPSRPTATRKRIVRTFMKTPKDFDDTKKVAILFKNLDAAKVPLSDYGGSPRLGSSKKWKDLLEKPKSPEYRPRINVLKRDLYPRKTKT